MSVDDLLAKADSRLTAADRDLKAGDVERSLSASYYAMFYAASEKGMRSISSITPWGLR